MQNSLLVPVALILGAAAIALALAGTQSSAAIARNDALPHSAAVEQPASRLERASDFSERAPVPVSDPAPRAVGEAAQPLPGARDALEDERSTDSAPQPVDRAARELEHDRATAKNRADRAAQQLKLTPVETGDLAELYLAFGQARREKLAALRAQQADHERMRQALKDLATWQSEQLAWQFGRELAGKIEGLDAPVDPVRVSVGAGN